MGHLHDSDHERIAHPKQAESSAFQPTCIIWLTGLPLLQRCHAIEVDVLLSLMSG